MALETTDTFESYPGNSSEEPYPIRFVFLEPGHIRVTVTDSEGSRTVLNSGQFTVTRFADGEGEVVTVEPWDSTHEITISRVTPATQPMVLQDGALIPAKTLERGLDRLVMIAQETRAEVDSKEDFHAARHEVGGEDALSLAQSQVTGLVDGLAAKANVSELSAHLADTGNPHAVTKAQVGLHAVDNTSDADKPVSSATQAALNAKAASAHTHDDRYYTESEVDGALAGKVPVSRSVSTSGLATGGGSLGADRTIEVPSASQAEAEAGTNNTKAMTPLRVAQAIAAQVEGGGGGASGVSLARQAWVEVDGHDGTGAVGNPGLPYLTAQAAFDDLNALGGSAPIVMHIGCGREGESITVSGVGAVGDHAMLVLRGQGTKLGIEGSPLDEESEFGVYIEAANTFALGVYSLQVHLGGDSEDPTSPLRMRMGFLLVMGSAGRLTGDIDLSGEIWGETGGILVMDGDVVLVGGVKCIGTSVSHTGAGGWPGDHVTGSDGVAGNPGDPPDGGSPGESATGGHGENGMAGNSGGSGGTVRLSNGAAIVGSVDAHAGDGGDGGYGGNGGFATGGTGGPGGYSTADPPGASGAGGDGGNATAGNGGNGGDGGAGGRGGIVVIGRNCTITGTVTYAAGAGGTGGAAGVGGNAYAGYPGTGGTIGAMGTATDGTAGSDGAPGVNGEAGQLYIHPQGANE